MVTIKEIAAAVGVSSATVSRVLNYDSTLSISNRKRQAIIETAEALNYATPRNRNRANQQGLNKVALVHFLAPERELVDPYYVGLPLGIERRCAALLRANADAGETYYATYIGVIDERLVIAGLRLAQTLNRSLPVAPPSR